MLLTVTIGTPKYLCAQDNCLVIKDRHEDKVLDKIPLSDIWVIIIDNPQVSITASLMGQVNDAGIGVLFCGSNHMPNGLALPIGAHSRHAEIVEHQLAISKPLRNQLWAKIVRRKIENQARALELSGGKPCDVEKILSYARDVQSNDKTHREGAAAGEYFSKLLPYGSRWTGPMTAPLNFGYAILRTGIAQCAVSHGWLVSRGIHHHSAENAFNLVDDLIEPFRAVVDLMVVKENLLAPLSRLNKDTLTKATSVLVLLDDKKMPVQTAIDVYCESLRRAIELKDSDQLLLPTLIGLEMATPDSLRTRGRL
ncbi:type II CRISPR-associated endonuclease Cas1 [Collinsella sp. CLA-AA-H302]|uniref:type II CRISPR-associated endonuclease Cas1 n=1 Tax=Collinsella sp. CLA-AA-H302 TaxID=3136217 RepID=UPI0032C004C4